MVLRRDTLEKQPSEAFEIEVDFTRAVPLGANDLVTAIGSAIKWQRRKPKVTSDATTEILRDVNGVIVGHECSENKLQARFFLENGDDDYDYKITVVGTFDNGAILEEDIYLRVREV